MIHLKNIDKFFTVSDEKIDIFSGMHFDVEKGDCVAVMWPSGTGKSTLLNLIAGLDEPQTGDVYIAGHNTSIMSIDERTAHRWKHIGFIFQDFHLIPNLTVQENIELVLDINAVKARFSVDEILDFVGIQHKKNVYPFQLSGGEKQRVAVARAFVADVPIILADEPTGNLDKKNADMVMKLMLDLQKKTQITIVMITHDITLGSMMDKLYVIRDQNIFLS